MKTIMRPQLSVFLPLCLCGCVSLFPDSGPAPKEILLESQKGALSTVSTHHKSYKKAILAVEQPSTPAFLNTRQIALRRLDNHLSIQDHVAGFIWHDTPSHQLAIEMQQTLLSQNIFKGVVPGTMNETSTFKLVSHINDATLDLTQDTPKVSLSLTVGLWHSAPQELVQQKVFTYSLDIGDQEPTTIQKAFGEMITSYLKDLTQWVGDE